MNKRDKQNCITYFVSTAENDLEMTLIYYLYAQIMTLYIVHVERNCRSLTDIVAVAVRVGMPPSVARTSRETL